MNVKDIFKTKKHGNIEVVEYFNNKKVKIKFIDTGTIRYASKQNIINGGIVDQSLTTIMKANDIFQTKKYGNVLILKYNGCYSVDIKFVDTGYISNVQSDAIKKGLVVDHTISPVANMKVGDIFQTNNYGKVEIVEYVNAHKINVKFLNTNETKWTQTGSIYAGTIRDDTISYLTFDVGNKFNTLLHGDIEIVDYNNANDLKFKICETNKIVQSKGDYVRHLQCRYDAIIEMQNSILNLDVKLIDIQNAKTEKQFQHILGSLIKKKYPGEIIEFEHAINGVLADRIDIYLTIRKIGIECKIGTQWSINHVQEQIVRYSEKLNCKVYGCHPIGSFNCITPADLIDKI